MAPPSPRSIGLPPQFEELREGQWEAIQLALRRSPRFEGVNAPTGFGKTLSYMAPALMTGMRTLIMTQTKTLADQIREVWECVGSVDIRGQNNYFCNYDALTTLAHVKVDEGPCHLGTRCDLKDDGGCTYFAALKLAKGAEIVVTNYAYRISSNRALDGGLGDFDLTICDEAHLAPEALSKALAIEVPYTLAQHKHVEPLPRDDDPATWAHWFMRQVYKLNNALDDAMRRAKVSPTVALLRQVRRLRNFAARFAAGTTITASWIIERGPTKVVWQPIWPAPYAEASLFRWSKKVMLYSAALRPKTMDLLGIPESQREFHEFDSTFPLHHRAITVVPTVRVDARLGPEGREQWLQRARGIVWPRSDRAGVVHTVSYPRAVEVARALSDPRGCPLGYRIRTHDTSGTRDTIAAFKAGGPSCLVSPSIGTGIDFPEDQCRYSIIAKVPFRDTREGIEKARAEADPDYGDYSAASEIVQIAGRGVRSKSDWCETFIIDDHFKDWFFKKAYAHWPSYFRQAVRLAGEVPPPVDLKEGP